MFKPNRLLTFSFLLAAIEGLVVTWFFAAKPVDPQTATGLGASAQRILLVAAAVGGVAAFGFLTVRSLLKPQWAEGIFDSLAQEPKKKPWLVGLCLLFAVGWLGSFVPTGQLNGVIVFYERIRPAVFWVTLVAGQTLITLLIRTEWKNEKSLLKLAALALGLFVLIWAFMALTKVGVTEDDRYWNEAGPPLLWQQILLTWIGSVGIGTLLFARRRMSWKMDVLVCVLLFLSAAYLWSQTPVDRSWFAPGPYPPNNVFYPYSDSQVYDSGAQYVFIGQGLNNSQATDKPFYMLFLALLHLIAGQDYSRTVQAQAICLAFFPALVYILGKLIHSRTAGVAAGILTILWETNSIASTLQIQVSHVRLMLTEMPTACMLALAAIVMILWLKRPRPLSLKMAILGGILGVAFLLRSNSLLLAPLVVALALAAFGRQWKKFLCASGLIVFGFLLVVTPWYLVNKTPAGMSFLEQKVRAVVGERYSEQINTPPAPVLPPYAAFSQPAPLPPTPATETTPGPASTPTPGSTSTPASTSTPVPGGQVPVEAGSSGASKSPMNSPFKFVPAHFFHNLDMSFLILPISFQSGDLSTILQAPYWNVHGVIDFSTAEIIFLFFNLLVLAVGTAAAWRGGGLGGVIPLLFFFVYNLANGLARNSGGRYLAPANWLIILYFGLGLIQLSRWGAALLGWRQEPLAQPAAPAAEAPAANASGRRAIWVRNAALLGVGLLLVGYSPLLIGRFFPVRYPVQSSEQLVQAALQRGSLQSAGISAQQVNSLMTQNGAMIRRGRELYPQYIYYDPTAPKKVLDLSFSMIESVTTTVILQMDTPLKAFPDAADVTVIGCGDGVNLWAQAVIVEGAGGPDTVYLRSSPASTWTCP